MIELTESANRLIGSQKAIEELSKKESARIIMLSDSHGNSEIFKQIITRYGKDCDAVIFCGDGASDLAHLLEDAENSEDIRQAIPPVIAYVQGNCDPVNYIPMLKVSPHEKLPAFQVLHAAGKSIYVCHGHNENVNFTLFPLALRSEAEECQIAVYGHTHIPDDQLESHKNIRIYNPGSCSRPRGNFPASFAILTITPNVTDAAFIRISDPFSHNPDFKVFTPLL